MKVVRPQPWHYCIAAAVCVTIAGLCLFFYWTHRTIIPSQPISPASSVTIPTNANQAIETPPTSQQTAGHTAPADQPRYLSIPKLDVRQARILGVGLDREGRIGVPTNIHDVAWYTGSSKPGQIGAALLDGHVSGPHDPGVFKKLSTLQTGDELQVELGDGSQLAYIVSAIQQTPATQVDMQVLLHPQPDNQQTLVLITCGGPLNKTTNTYNDRVVVTASRNL